MYSQWPAFWHVEVNARGVGRGTSSGCYRWTIARKIITTCWEGSKVPGNSRPAIHKFSPNVCSTAESKQGHMH